MVNLKDLSFSNLEVFDYQTALQILTENAFVENDKNEKIAIFVVGPNGSGKSTLIANLYKGNRTDIPYINADILALKLPNENIYSIAGKTIELIKEKIQKGQSFVYETVFSDLNKLELARLAKSAGFKLICIAVTTSSPEININRVSKRVSQGGHNVPEEKIIMRYSKSLNNINTLKPLCDKFILLDNSLDR